MPAQAHGPAGSLRAQRQRRGWTHADVAAGLHTLAEELDEPLPGVDANLVCKWENGQRTPGPFYQPRLCLLFGMEPEALGFQPTPRLLRDLQGLSMIRVKRRQFLMATTAAFVGAALPDAVLDQLIAGASPAPWSRLPPAAASESRPAEHFLLVRKSLADSDN